MEVISLQSIIAEKFYEIERNFKSASSKMNLKYDYDVFCDTYLKCCETLEGKVLSEKSIIQYFWTAFANNSRKKNRKSKYIPHFTEMNDSYNEIEDETTHQKYEIVDTIKDSVTIKFGDDSFKMWYLHFIENKSYVDLINMGYNNINFHNLFRRITNYIKNKLPLENKEYQMLIKETLRQ